MTSTDNDLLCDFCGTRPSPAERSICNECLETLTSEWRARLDSGVSLKLLDDSFLDGGSPVDDGYIDSLPKTFLTRIASIE